MLETGDSTKTVSIVVVGTEILKGLVQDTNSHWLAKRLTEMGFSVIRIIVVPDSRDAITWALKSTLEISDIVVVTGGLGFTEDDVTLDAAARALGLRLVLSAEAVEMLKKRVGEDIRNYIKAACIPEGGKPLYNSVGVSPGVHLSINSKDVFLLPGVPVEMIKMFEDHVEPVLRSKVAKVVAKVMVVTEHLKESEVDSLIAKLREEYKDVYFKTHASTPVTLSVVIMAASKSELESKLKMITSKVKSVLKVREIKVQY